MGKLPLSHLVVLAYADEYRAAEVLATLQRLRTGAMLDTQDATSVMRATDRSVTLHYSADLGPDAERAGRFWRALIASLLLAPGGSTRRIRPEVCGLDPGFVLDLNAAMPPGSSAVLLLVARSARSRVFRELACFGGNLLETPIDRVVIGRLCDPPPSASKSGGRQS
jgi:uncharacterized membrane protein